LKGMVEVAKIQMGLSSEEVVSMLLEEIKSEAEQPHATDAAKDKAVALKQAAERYLMELHSQVETAGPSLGPSLNLEQEGQQTQESALGQAVLSSLQDNALDAVQTVRTFVVPEGKEEGDKISITFNRIKFDITVPPGKRAGDSFTVDFNSLEAPKQDLAEETIRTFMVPEGKQEGDKMAVTHNHMKYEVEIPTGKKVGDSFAVDMAVLEAASQDTAEEAIRTFMIPEGKQEGDKIATTYNHMKYDVEIPAGKRVGDIFSVDMALLEPAPQEQPPKPQLNIDQVRQMLAAKESVKTVTASDVQQEDEPNETLMMGLAELPSIASADVSSAKESGDETSQDEDYSNLKKVVEGFSLIKGLTEIQVLETIMEELSSKTFTTEESQKKATSLQQAGARLHEDFIRAAEAAAREDGEAAQTFTGLPAATIPSSSEQQAMHTLPSEVHIATTQTPASLPAAQTPARLPATIYSRINEPPVEYSLQDSIGSQMQLDLIQTSKSLPPTIFASVRDQPAGMPLELAADLRSATNPIPNALQQNILPESSTELSEQEMELYLNLKQMVRSLSEKNGVPEIQVLDTVVKELDSVGSTGNSEKKVWSLKRAAIKLQGEIMAGNMQMEQMDPLLLIQPLAVQQAAARYQDMLAQQNSLMALNVRESSDETNPEVEPTDFYDKITAFWNDGILGIVGQGIKDAKEEFQSAVRFSIADEVYDNLKKMVQAKSVETGIPEIGLLENLLKLDPPHQEEELPIQKAAAEYLEDLLRPSSSTSTTSVQDTSISRGSLRGSKLADDAAESMYLGQEYDYSTNGVNGKPTALDGPIISPAPAETETIPIKNLNPDMAVKLEKLAPALRGTLPSWEDPKFIDLLAFDQRPTDQEALNVTYHPSTFWGSLSSLMSLKALDNQQSAQASSKVMTDLEKLKARDAQISSRNAGILTLPGSSPSLSTSSSLTGSSSTGWQQKEAESSSLSSKTQVDLDALRSRSSLNSNRNAGILDSVTPATSSISPSVVASPTAPSTQTSLQNQPIESPKSASLMMLNEDGFQYQGEEGTGSDPLFPS